jgi:DNA repair protein RecO
MSTLKHIAVEGFILKKRPYKESDEIVTMFTQQLGKIRIFAKGVKKITSKRLSHLQTGNYVSCILSRRDDLYFLQETYLRSGLSKVKTSPGSMNYLYQYVFILDRLLPELEQEEDVYDAVCGFCKELSVTSSFSRSQMNGHIESLLVLLGHGGAYGTAGDIVAHTENVMQEKLPLHVII